MAKIHSVNPKSSVVPLPEFDTFGVPPTQTTVEGDICTEHRPTSTLSSKAFIMFDVTSGLDEYMRLNRSKFYMRGRVIIDKPMKAKVTQEDWKGVSTVNHPSSAVFKQVDLVIGDRTVTMSNQTYAYKADFEIRLGKSREIKKSFLTGGLWYADDPDKPEEINQIRSSFLAPESTSEDKSIGREFDLLGDIYLDMFQQERPLIGGCNIKLKFIPNDPSFYMMCTPNIRVAAVEFTDAVLFMHRSKISRPVLEGHLKALMISNAQYPLRRSFVVSSTINKGTMDALVDNVYNGHLPRRAFVSFVKHSAYNGSFHLNPFNYQHFNFNYLAFHLNGIQYPEKAFTPDFSRGHYIREYLSLFEATNQMDDSCITFDRRAFATGSTMVGVNFAPDLSSGCCASGYVSPIRYGSLRVQVRFKEALSETINMLVYLDFDDMIEINQERNPIFDFN